MLNWSQRLWIRRASQYKIRTGSGSDRPNTQVLQRLCNAWVRFTVESLAGRYRSRFWFC